MSDKDKLKAITKRIRKAIDNDEELNILYDLIKADMVEKVEE